MIDTHPFSSDEQALQESYEQGEWRSVTAVQERLQAYRAYATSALEAEGVISIVLPPEDLQALRRKATEAGVPYQALIADVVHRFLSGRLVERAR